MPNLEQGRKLEEEALRELPSEKVDSFTHALGQFLRIEAAAGLFLLVFAVAAVGAANSAWAGPFLAFWETSMGLRLGDYEFTRSLRHWINDGLMTLFFFVVALELKRELVLGELRNPRTAALSLAAALGGILVPASFYLVARQGAPGANAWGTVMATDTAFVIGCLAVVGNRVPLSLRLFLLSLAIFDDIGAVLVVAFGYGGTFQWVALLTALLLFGLVALLAQLGVRSIPLYSLVGFVIWLAVDASGIHATVAGVILGLMTPTGRWVSGDRRNAIFHRVRHLAAETGLLGGREEREELQRAGTAARESLSPVERLESALHAWVAFGVMPLFAIANAGVPWSFLEMDFALAATVFFSFVIGKPLGVLLFSALAIRLGLATRPADLSWGMLAAGAVLTGIGFTMALFIAELAFEPKLLNSAKVGILGSSVAAGTIGILAMYFSTVGKSKPESDSAQTAKGPRE